MAGVPAVVDVHGVAAFLEIAVQNAVRPNERPTQAWNDDGGDFAPGSLPCAEEEGVVVADVEIA